MPDQAELLDMAIGRIRDAGPYWNFYIVVVSAIIALMASGRSLVAVTKVRIALGILATLRPEPAWLYVAFHVLLDIAVVAAILNVPWPVEPKK